MTTLKHAIEIDRSIQDVYDVARQVERYPEFMPDYLSSDIIQRYDDGFMVERTALVEGKLYRWKSRATLRQDKGIYFEHCEGPLHGMRVAWELEKLGAEKTRLTITHVLRVAHRIPFWGWVQERRYYRPKINDIAGRVILSFKKACEERDLVPA